MNLIKFLLLTNFTAAIILLSSCNRDNSYRYPAGIEIRKEFPELPLPLYSVVEGLNKPSVVSISLPDNYTPEKQYPLFVWLQGSTGGLGDNVHSAKAITGGQDFICVNLPLYKKEVDPLLADSSNYWNRMVIQHADIAGMWANFKVMLDSVNRWIPNIDTTRRFIGGFSNGAHTTAFLLYVPGGEVFRYFNRFILVEGGGRLNEIDAVKGRPIIIFEGDKREKRKFERMVSELENKQLPVTHVLMVDTGHKFPDKYKEVLLDWMQSN